MKSDGDKRAARRLPVVVLRLLWIAVVLWYELAVFSSAARRCNWPDAPLRFTETTKPPTHVLVVADPQILDHRSYPGRHPVLTFVSRIMVDLNMRKNWRAAMKLHPDAIIFLGDMMDNGRYDMPDAEYNAYYERFKDIFRVDRRTPVYYLPGNHDTGLGTSSTFSSYARDRYVTHFGPLNQHFSIGNHTFVLLDAPSLVEEDRRRHELGMNYDNWTPSPGGTVQYVQYLAPDRYKKPVILCTHIPLYRPDGASCGPLRETGTIHRGVGFGYQNTLSESASRFLIERIRPSLVLSGDDHDYCEHVHKMAPSDDNPSMKTEVREVTVKSFSMAMGIRKPGFQLLSLAPTRLNPHGYDEEAHSTRMQSYSDVPCQLPDQLGIYIAVYPPLIVISLVAIVASAYLTGAPGRKAFMSQPGRNSHSLDRRSDDVSLDESDDAYHLPVLNPRPAPASRGQNGYMHARSQPRSFWTFDFSVGGHRRRLSVGNPLSQKRLNGVFDLLSRGRGRSRNKRELVRRVVDDVWDVAWPPLVLFLGIAAWMFW